MRIVFDNEINAVEINLNGIDVCSVAVEATAGGVAIITLHPHVCEE